MVVTLLIDVGCPVLSRLLDFESEFAPTWVIEFALEQVGAFAGRRGRSAC